MEPTPNEVWIEYLCVEDGMPHFSNSLAKKAARLRNRVSRLLSSGNAARLTLRLTYYGPSVSSHPPKVHLHDERLSNSNKC